MNQDSTDAQEKDKKKKMKEAKRKLTPEDKLKQLEDRKRREKLLAR